MNKDWKDGKSKKKKCTVTDLQKFGYDKRGYIFDKNIWFCGRSLRFVYVGVRLFL